MLAIQFNNKVVISYASAKNNSIRGHRLPMVYLATETLNGSLREWGPTAFFYFRLEVKISAILIYKDIYKGEIRNPTVHYRCRRCAIYAEANLA